MIIYKPYGSVPPGYGAVPELTGYWVYRGVPPSLARSAADLHYDVGDTMVTAVRIDTSEAEALDLLFHEAFHVYQETQFGEGKRFTWGPGFRDTVPGTGQQERKLLRCATTAGDLDDVRRYASEYVRHRLYRMATEQDGIVQAEHLVERKEGSAQWVGMKMQGVVLGRTEPVVRQAIADLLDWEYPAQPVQMFADGLPFDHRQSLYATGAAIIELLSRLAPGPWQQTIAGGSPPFQVLEQALGDADLPRGTTTSEQDEVGGMAEWHRCGTNGV